MIARFMISPRKSIARYGQRSCQRMRRRHLKRGAQRGVVLVLFLLFLAPMLLLISLAIDGSMLLTADLQQENNAEYAAEAAALQLWVRPAPSSSDPDGDACANHTPTSGPGGTECDEEDDATFTLTDAQTIANTVAASNLYILGEVQGTTEGKSEDDVGDTLEIGCWTGTAFRAESLSHQDPPCLAGEFKATRVQLGIANETSMIATFGRSVGFSEFGLKASAVAFVSGTTVYIKRGA